MENAYSMKYLQNGQFEKIWYNTYKRNRKLVLRMGGKTSTASKRKWNNENYEYTQLVTQKGEKERIKQAAKQAGQSVNAYVVEAVRRRMEQEQMLSASDTPGEVKNLDGDADPVEWDSCSISPDLIES